MAETEEKMVTKHVVKTVKVVRDGERIRVPAGKTAEFTEDEVTSVNKATPGALRDPVNETAASEESGDKAEKKPAKKSGKKETAAEKKARLEAEAALDTDEGSEGADDDL